MLPCGKSVPTASPLAVESPIDKSQMTLLKQVLHAAILITGLLAAVSSGRAVEIAAPYVPTAPSIVERMLEIAKVGPSDYLIDLGAGDGRIVITAAKKYGASGFGVEIDWEFVKRYRA